MVSGKVHAQLVDARLWGSPDTHRAPKRSTKILCFLVESGNVAAAAGRGQVRSYRCEGGLRAARGCGSHDGTWE